MLSFFPPIVRDDSIPEERELSAEIREITIAQFKACHEYVTTIYRTTAINTHARNLIGHDDDHLASDTAKVAIGSIAACAVLPFAFTYFTVWVPWMAASGAIKFFGGTVGSVGFVDRLLSKLGYWRRFGYEAASAPASLVALAYRNFHLSDVLTRRVARAVLAFLSLCVSAIGLYIISKRLRKCTCKGSAVCDTCVITHKCRRDSCALCKRRDSLRNDQALCVAAQGFADGTTTPVELATAYSFAGLEISQVFASIILMISLALQCANLTAAIFGWLARLQGMVSIAKTMRKNVSKFCRWLDPEAARQNGFSNPKPGEPDDTYATAVTAELPLPPGTGLTNQEGAVYAQMANGDDFPADAPPVPLDALKAVHRKPT